MGRGDKKSRKGKIWKGTYGNTRKRKVKKTGAAPVGKAEAVTEAKPKAKKAPKKRAKASE